VTKHHITKNTGFTKTVVPGLAGAAASDVTVREVG
jgi:hypothetical protein